MVAIYLRPAFEWPKGAKYFIEYQRYIADMRFDDTFLIYHLPAANAAAMTRVIGDRRALDIVSRKLHYGLMHLKRRHARR